jgi:hypothetical protein
VRAGQVRGTHVCVRTSRTVHDSPGQAEDAGIHAVHQVRDDLVGHVEPGASDGPMIMNGFNATRSKPGRSRSTNVHAARSAMVFDS